MVSTPPILCSIRGCLVKLLIDIGANVNAKDNKGITPLIVASIEGHLDVIKLLIDKGADVNDRDNIGTTPLICASNKGHLAVVQLLIDKGAEVKDRHNVSVTTFVFTTHFVVLLYNITLVFNY
eukprot:GHVR01008694.1.p1 GENE.GHVR01008694.1~~GHVR01008694.1.p1  ORF type:complete len:123 (+),score=13.34 GHVR01008694.1:185-553(+)